MSGPRLRALTLAAEPAPWRDAGFSVDGASARVGTIELRLAGAGAGEGIAGWELDGAAAESIDGLPTAAATEREVPQPPAHANTAVGIDHVAVSTPHLERTLAALEAAGFDLRRTRDAGSIRQAFYVIGDAVLEVVGEAGARGAGPAEFWGLVVVVADIDACAELLGDRLGAVKDAVQPGRRIATVRAEAQLGTRVAVITPRR